MIMEKPFRFLNTKFLRNDEITLRLVKKVKRDDERGWVPTYHFDICKTGAKGAQPLGMCDLRVGHNEKTYYGGNIGYGVYEEHRGNHYAGKACLLLYELARKHGMEYVIITCNPDNVLSRKTCEYADCELIEIVALPPDNDMYLEGEREKCIYKITL